MEPEAIADMVPEEDFIEDEVGSPDLEEIELKSGTLNSYCEFKTLDENGLEEGKFVGYGSIFNNTDLGGDVVIEGAFEKSLRKSGPKGVKLLYQHKSDMPIGIFEEIQEDRRGLKVSGQLAMKTQAGREAYELLKMGALDGLSIGYKADPKRQEYDERRRRRRLKEVDLMENSLVTFPMNPRARVSSVKAEEMTVRDWEGGMREAFDLSRSEAKLAAKAVTEAFKQRDADDESLVEAIRQATSTLTNGGRESV